MLILAARYPIMLADACTKFHSFGYELFTAET